MTKNFQIKVGKHQTGIIGIDEVLKEIEQEGKNISVQEIGALMVEKLSKKNISHQLFLIFTHLPLFVNI